jgi:hypothetical protein
MCDLCCNVRASLAVVVDVLKTGLDLEWLRGSRPLAEYREHSSGSLARTLQEK